MTIPSLFVLWCSLLAGNILYQVGRILFGATADWHAAVERTWFQGVALLLVWAVLRVKS